MKITKTRASISDRVGVKSRATAPSAGPEFEPYFRSSNVLTDPGFSNYRDNSGGWWWPDREGGSTQYIIPFFSVLNCVDYLEWPDGSCVEDLLVGWCQTSGPRPPLWQTTTFDAHLPEYGAVWFRWSDDVNLCPAELSAYSPYVAPFSCRVEPGDSVTWSGWARVSQLEGAPAITLILRWYNSSGSLFSVTQGTTTALSMTRTQYSYALSAPASTHYLRATYAFSGAGTPGTVTVVDTARLGVL